MMAKQSKEQNTQAEGASEEQAAATAQTYERLIGELRRQRKVLQDDISREYRDARRYVRSHPEEGVLVGFAAGLALGVVVGRLMK